MLISVACSDCVFVLWDFDWLPDVAALHILGFLTLVVTCDVDLGK